MSSGGGAAPIGVALPSGGGVFIEIYLISIVAVIRRLISIVLVCLSPLGSGGAFLRRGRGGGGAALTGP